MVCVDVVGNGIDGFDGGKDRVFEWDFMELGRYGRGEVFEKVVGL